MKRFYATAAALCAIFASSQATADELVLEAGVSTAYYTDSSFDALSEYNSHSNFVLGAAWGFDQLAGLRTGLMFQTTPRLVSSRFSGNLQSEWGRQRFLATADWGFHVLRILRPHVDVGVGYAHQFLELQSVGPRLKDHAHDFTANGGIGLDAALPLSFGAVTLATSFGYEGQTNARFDELRHDKDAFEADYAPEDDPWDRAHADYGTLKLNGLYWTIGLEVSFDL